MKTTYIVAQIPDELELAFLAHVRGFDKAHPGCHFSVAVDAPDSKTSEIIDRVREAQEKLGLPLFGFTMERRSK
jgi:hypothetical protein